MQSINIKRLACLSFALAALGCKPSQTVNVASSARPVVKLTAKESAEKCQTMLKDLRLSGYCLYAWETSSGNIVRMTLDGKRKETVISCGIRNKAAMVGMGSPTGSVYPGLSGDLQMTGLGGYMTIAKLDYSNDIALHARIYRQVFAPLDFESSVRPQQTVTRQLYDAASFKSSNWTCTGDYGVKLPNIDDVNNGFAFTTIGNGEISRTIPNGHRIVGFFEPGYALIATRDKVYAYDLIRDAYVNLLNTRCCELWPTDMNHPYRFKVEIKGGTDRNHVYRWTMRNPADYKPRP